MVDCWGPWYEFTEQEFCLIKDLQKNLKGLNSSKRHGSFCQHLGMGKCGSTFFHIKVWPFINLEHYFFLNQDVQYSKNMGKLFGRRNSSTFGDSKNLILKRFKKNSDASIINFAAHTSNLYSLDHFKEVLPETTNKQKKVFILIARSHKELLTSQFSHQLNKGALDRGSKLKELLSIERHIHQFDQLNANPNIYNVDRLNYPLIISTIKNSIDCEVFFVDLDSAIKEYEFWHKLLLSFGYTIETSRKASSFIQEFVSSMAPVKQHTNRAKIENTAANFMTKEQEDSLDELWEKDCQIVASMANTFVMDS